MRDSARITLSCSCGSKLAVPVSAAGKKTKCPKCTQILSVPSVTGPDASRPVAATSLSNRANPAAMPSSSLRPKPVAAASSQRRGSSQATPLPPPPPALPDEDDDPGYSVALDEMVGEAAAAPQPAAADTSCPKCGAAMPSHIVLCISCGYDSRSGKVLKTKRRRESAAGEAAKTAGRFVMGLVLSSVGALIGAVIWCVVAFVTDYEIGWIAWGVGFLAGLGMKLGYGDESDTAGFASAGIAVAGILVAKAVIFVIISAALAQGGEPPIGFAELFGLWDALFFFLAAATAYKIGNGSYGAD